MLFFSDQEVFRQTLGLQGASLSFFIWLARLGCLLTKYIFSLQCFNVGVGALDQLFIRDGTLDKLIWNDNWSVDETVSFFRYLADKKLPSRWSPLGSFFVSSNYNLVIIWGSRYYTDFGRLMRFNHYQVCLLRIYFENNQSCLLSFFFFLNRLLILFFFFGS